MMVNTVFTIGYSGFQLNDFIKILKDNRILLVIDVRSLPYSQHYADFNKENISKILESSKIYYRNYALEFGARQEEKNIIQMVIWILICFQNQNSFYLESKNWRNLCNKITRLL